MKNITRFPTIVAVTVCLALLSSVQAQEEKKDHPKSASPGLVKLTAKSTPLLQGDKITFFGDSVTMQGVIST